jgi:tagaturonate reductase
MESRPGPADFALTLNTRLERLMPVFAPAGVILGFLLPALFIRLRPFIPWIFGIMTLSGAIKLKAREFGLVLRDPLPIAITLLSSHLIMPLAVFFLSTLVFREAGGIIAGYVLVYSVPTAVSGFIWVNMYRGDNALVLALILLSTLAAPVIVPFTVSSLLGARVALDMQGIALSLVTMVAVPTVIGIGANEISRGKIPRILSPGLNPLAKLCLILVIAANAAAVAPRIRLDNPQVWIIAGLCILFAAIAYCLAWLIGLACRLNGEKQVTVFFSAGLRNISAAATIAIEFFPEQAALPALLGIVFQQTMAALMGRLFLGSRFLPGRHRLDKLAGGAGQGR